MIVPGVGERSAEWQGPRDPRREIRVWDLLRMSSDLDFDNFGLDPRNSYNAGVEHFSIYFDALDIAPHAVHQPLGYRPGSVWRHRNSDPLTLVYVARRALEAKSASSTCGTVFGRATGFCPRAGENS
ncbi:MAG: hypothetical protein KatS3mg081_1399 [Gemmatimonadales bacterium]|nr:MAG: hypothetical protein KatS3mg081_1399 [Gemmatimonadales bacterium]